jgi:hypothetical protein
MWSSPWNVHAGWTGGHVSFGIEGQRFPSHSLNPPWFVSEWDGHEIEKGGA